MPNLLKPGGHLIYETFGAFGGNWRSLPGPGHVRQTLMRQFELEIYREVAVVASAGRAATVKALAQLRE